MKLAEIISTLSSNNLTELPVAALLSAREHWSELLPVIDVLMHKFTVEEDLIESEANLLFFGICLIVDRKQFSHFNCLINLTDKEDCDSPLERLLGDFIGSDLSTAYYILAQGKPEQLCRLVNSDQAGDIVKMAALGTLFVQLHTDQIDRDTLNKSIPDFIEKLVTNDQSLVMFELVNLLISYEFNQYHGQFLSYIKNKIIDESPIENQIIIDWNNNSIGYSEWDNGLINGDYDVIDALSMWTEFGPEGDMSDAELMEIFDDLMNTPNNFDDIYFDSYLENMDSHEIQQPQITDIKAGRNDPCPCGSGKKYKKCCLN
ncbi:MAG: DUF1186 domain-containing protein [Shewanella sp.]